MKRRPIVTREKCHRCGQEVDVMRGRIALHDVDLADLERYTRTRFVGVQRGPRQCTGSGERPESSRAKGRDASAAKRAAEIAKVRDDATVALDALIEGLPTFDADHPRLLKLAMQGWRLANPGHIGDPLGFSNKPRGNTRRNGADAYCLFCGELIGTLPVKWRWHMATGRVAFLEEFTRHVIRCALTFLAGMRPAAKAGTRLLPRQMTIGSDE